MSAYRRASVVIVVTHDRRRLVVISEDATRDRCLAATSQPLKITVLSRGMSFTHLSDREVLEATVRAAAVERRTTVELITC